MWYSFYDSLIEMTAGSWDQFTASYGREGTALNTAFTTQVYMWAAIILWGICGLFNLLYYFYFNRRFGNYYRLRTYLYFAITAVLLVTCLTWLSSHLLVSEFTCPTGALVNWLTLINLICAGVLFFVLSLVCQALSIGVRKTIKLDLSPMGNRTPL